MCGTMKRQNTDVKRKSDVLGELKGERGFGSTECDIVVGALERELFQIEVQRYTGDNGQDQ